VLFWNPNAFLSFQIIPRLDDAPSWNNEMSFDFAQDGALGKRLTPRSSVPATATVFLNMLWRALIALHARAREENFV
jgi:hypothetical protein